MQLISQRVAAPDFALPEIPLHLERLKLAKRRWRATAEDGAEFGVELAAPLADGDTLWQTSAARYVVRQSPEPLLEITLALEPAAAAAIGWAIGNLHLELSAGGGRMLTVDDPATRQLLDRLGIAYREVQEKFRAGRFEWSDGELTFRTNDLGPSHRH